MRRSNPRNLRSWALLLVLAMTLIGAFEEWLPRVTAFTSLSPLNSRIPMVLSAATKPTSAEWEEAQAVQVVTLNGDSVSLGSLLTDVTSESSSPSVILSCLSHFGDFNAWELTQQYQAALKYGRLDSKQSPIVLVGIGSLSAAQKFAEDLELMASKELPPITLVADDQGAVAKALGCYQGWLAADQEHKERYPQTDINPYIKLLGMIFGLGSPGTIQKVLYGYIGDFQKNNGYLGRQWVVQSLLQGSSKGRFPELTPKAFESIPIESSLRPFELATLRLQTGLHIVKEWGKLGPKNGDLFTQMGGTFVCSRTDEGLDCQWSTYDQGILSYADVDEVAEVVQAVSERREYLPLTRTERSKKMQGYQTAFLQEQQAKAELEKQARQSEISKKLKEDEKRRAKITKERIQEAGRLTEEVQTPVGVTPAPFFAGTPEETVEKDTVNQNELLVDADFQGLDELTEAVSEELDEEAIDELEMAIPSPEETLLAPDQHDPLSLADQLDPEPRLIPSNVTYLPTLAESNDNAIIAEDVSELEAQAVDNDSSDVMSSVEVQTLSDVDAKQKELFQRSLLAEQVKYAKTPRLFAEQPARMVTTVRAQPDKRADEMFHRKLLQATNYYRKRDTIPPAAVTSPLV